MLRKLIKHELRATSKIFLSLFAAVVALMGGFQMIFLVARLLTGRDDTHPLLALLFGLFSVLSAFALLAMMAVLVIVPVQRFYKNLLGDEGYLMFTLPATPAQQILSKLTTGLIWMFVGMIVCILAVLLFAWNLPDITAIPSIPASFQAQTGMSFYSALFLFGLFMLLVFANAYLYFYLCIAIGGQWPQNRLLASAVAYLILNAVLQFVVFFGIIAAALIFSSADISFFRSLQSLAKQSPTGFFYGMLGVSAVVMIVLNLVYFFVTRWLLSKRLNLA